MTQVELAAAADIAEATVQNLEYAKSRKRRPSSLPRLEPALGWATGSGELIADGKPPRPLSPAGETGSPAAGATTDPANNTIPLRVAHALAADGPLLDATVIDLSVDGEPDAQMVVVIKGKPSRTPEQYRRAIAAWEQKFRYLQAAQDDEAPDTPTANEA